MNYLDHLHQDNKDCRLCELRSGCNQVVVGNGNAKAKIFVVGEYPNYDDDLDGQAFSSMSNRGKLLLKILDKSEIGFHNIYFTNIVKCKPAGTNIPNKEHIQTCKVWLWKELKLIQPKVVVTLGKIPTKLIFKLTKSFALKDIILCGAKPLPYMTECVAFSWYSLGYLFNRGRELEQQTIDFFKDLKQYAEALV